MLPQSCAGQLWVLHETELKLSGASSNIVTEGGAVCSTCWASTNQMTRAFPSNLHGLNSPVCNLLAAILAPLPAELVSRIKCGDLAPERRSKSNVTAEQAAAIWPIVEQVRWLGHGKQCCWLPQGPMNPPMHALAVGRALQLVHHFAGPCALLARRLLGLQPLCLVRGALAWTVPAYATQYLNVSRL